jgi:glycine hydroxymethyltransferase
MTTRGFTEIEAEMTANLMADVLESPDDTNTLDRVRRAVNELTRRFPVYTA